LNAINAKNIIPCFAVVATGTVPIANTANSTDG
jgi:hypothetical protein